MWLLTCCFYEIKNYLTKTQTMTYLFKWAADISSRYKHSLTSLENPPKNLSWCAACWNHRISWFISAVLSSADWLLNLARTSFHYTFLFSFWSDCSFVWKHAEIRPRCCWTWCTWLYSLVRQRGFFKNFFSWCSKLIMCKTLCTIFFLYTILFSV